MRTTIDLDVVWVEAARVLGTSGKTETVNAALAAVVEQARRLRAVETFRTVRLDLDEATMSGAWRE